MIQKQLTQFLTAVWILAALAGMFYMTPVVQSTFKISLIIAGASTLVMSALITGIFHILPLMLGLGVMFYHKQWKKAEDRSIRLQASIYESYLVSLTRPFMFQLLFFVPGVVLIGYYLNHKMSESLYDTWQICVGYVTTFMLGAATRVGFEFFEVWRKKSQTKNNDIGKNSLNMQCL